MAWTDPRDWANGNIPSGSDLNTHLRDNLKHIYDSIHGVSNEALTILGDLMLRDDGPINVTQQRNSGDVSGGILRGQKSRGTNGAPTIITALDQLWSLRFAGYDGAAYIDAAAITGWSDGAPGLNDMPGMLAFYTTPDGSATLVERMRINAAGQVLTSDGSISLPGVGYISEPSMGMRRAGSQDLRLTVNGVDRLQLQATLSALVAAGASSVILGSSANALGFFSSNGTTKVTITGSRGANAALASLLTALSGHGLIVDNTT